MDPRNGSDGNHHLTQTMSLRQRPQQATNDEGFGNQRTFEQQLPAHDPAHVSQFGVDNRISRTGMPDGTGRFVEIELSVAGAGGAADIDSLSFGDLTPQMGPSLRVSDHDASSADMLQHHGAQQLQNLAPSYTNSYERGVHEPLQMTSDGLYHLNEYQMPATPYYYPRFSAEELNTDMATQEAQRRALASLQDSEASPWTTYRAGEHAGNSGTLRMSSDQNGDDTLSPHRQTHGRDSMPRQTSIVSSRSMPAKGPRSSHLPGFQSSPGPSGRRVSAVEDSRSLLRQSSPNLSILTDESLHCGIGACNAIFTGYYRKGNRARHWRQKHRHAEVLHCEDPGCKKTYKRQDARLKHYRKYHPKLAPGPALSRKLYVSM